ncbi:MAG: hypothetical protein JXN64_01560 [Spirochaetes bacterium]|nr:hypothetical protein [Spirochaetota bacterium]
MAERSNGLVIVNVSDLSNITEAGHLDTDSYAFGVVVSGKYAYMADYQNGLVIADVSDPANPTQAGHFVMAGDAYGVF